MNTTIRIVIGGLFLSFLFLGQSCDKIKDEINEAAAFHANIELPAETIEIDSTQFKSSDGLMEWVMIMKYHVPVGTDVEKILQDNGLSSASLSDGSFTYINFSLQPPTPEWVTFSFADRFKVGISRLEDLSDEVILGETMTIPPDSRSVDLELAGVDVTSYVDDGTFWLSVYGFRVQPLPIEMVSMALNSTIKVKINPL